MLKLARGRVTEIVGGRPEATELIYDADGAERKAFADTSLTGPVETGDEIVANTEAVQLGLGSGGRDIVLVNLTRGVGATADGEAHVMKLNYSPLQHAIEPIELQDLGDLSAIAQRPVAVFQIHAQLPCIAWQAARKLDRLQLGYVQTAGGALPGTMSNVTAQLREQGLICEHVTVSPTYGGDAEAISVIGALHAGFVDRGWQAAVVGPGPGILGSATALGHGSIYALDALHAALALGLNPVMAVRASSGDPRERHRGISHHTRSVLQLALRPVDVAVAAGSTLECEEFSRHRVATAEIELDGYEASDLPAATMGRNIRQDTVFFQQALAAGAVLGDLSRARSGPSVK